ncbi:MAG TPA: hypothetical protein VG710_16605 [Opitutus sp.]|nr:hypothetical protein [Opitutus sp.]
MITNHWFRSRRLQTAFAGIVFSLCLLGNTSVALGAGWSQGVAIASSVPSAAPNAFAFNPAGNELWATAPAMSGGATVQVAQRPFGGAWSPLTTIATIHSVGALSVQDLSISLSASSHAAAVWLVGGGVQIALRSSTGAWQAPVGFVPTGGASRLRSRLDAHGNGVAAWARATSTGSVVEAVAWTASGTFGAVTQLSPSSQGAYLPDLSVNEAGTAVVVWQVADPQNAGSPYQVESVTRSAGGNWSMATTASPVVPQTWSPQVALDGAGNATAVWEQGSTVDNYRIYAATQRAGGPWSSPVRIEPSDWYMAAQPSVAADAAGNVTASWVVENTSGAMLVHAATRSAGGAWGTPVNLGQLTASGSSPNLLPPVSAARDGSITVVGWAAFGGTGPNVAVRSGSGPWVPMIIGGNPQPFAVLTTNNARASVVWSVGNGVKYHRALMQSDYQ